MQVYSGVSDLCELVIHCLSKLIIIGLKMQMITCLDSIPFLTVFHRVEDELAATLTERQCTTKLLT